ncbi:hypothetical protein ACFJGW_04565 [Burkholderiaceae bacterium UC74_6]
MKSSENQKTQSQDAAKPASPSRRRLLRAGAIGAPALLALKSTPVMACNCKLPSGFSVSGNASHNQGSTCSSPGKTPTWWSGQCDSNGYYSGTSCNKTHQYSTYFTCTTTYKDKTLNTCLKTSDTDHQSMAMACYLQACTEGGSHFPTNQTVKDIWNQGVCGAGYPVPGSSSTWNKNQCLSYLQYLTGQKPSY